MKKEVAEFIVAEVVNYEEKNGTEPKSIQLSPSHNLTQDNVSLLVFIGKKHGYVYHFYKVGKELFLQHIEAINLFTNHFFAKKFDVLGLMDRT